MRFEELSDDEKRRLAEKAEARLAKDRLKSKRYYEKHREQLLTRMQARRRLLKKASAWLRDKETPHGTDSGETR